MGLILDSSILIQAERQGVSVSSLLASLSDLYQEVDISLSAVSVFELEHGYYRANSPSVAARRRRYIDDALSALPVETLTEEIARYAASIDASCKNSGLVIPVSDLLIGATALYFGHGVVTHNVRHFRMVPGLSVVCP